MEVVYLFLTSVAMDGGAREFFMDEKSERKGNKYTAFMPLVDFLFKTPFYRR